MDRTFLGVGGRRTSHKTNSGSASSDGENETTPASSSAPYISNITSLEPVETRIWTKLVKATRIVENTIRDRVSKEFGISLARFEILSQLCHHPEGLRMTDLSNLLMISNGSLTGTVAGLVDDRLIERLRNEGDRRSVHVRVLAEGRQLYEAIERRKREWLVGILGDLSRSAKSELLERLTLLDHHLSEYRQ